jgi:hypothetical protein
MSRGKYHQRRYLRRFHLLSPNQQLRERRYQKYHRLKSLQ